MLRKGGAIKLAAFQKFVKANCALDDSGWTYSVVESFGRFAGSFLSALFSMFAEFRSPGNGLALEANLRYSRQHEDLVEDEGWELIPVAVQGNRNPTHAHPACL